MSPMNRAPRAFALLLALAVAPAWADDCRRGALPTDRELLGVSAPGAASASPLEIARQQIRAGRHAEARESLAKVIAGNPPQRGLALSLLAVAQARGGEFAAARASARGALEAGATSPAERAIAALNAGVALAGIGEPDEAIEAFGRSAAFARESGDEPVVARALANRAATAASASHASTAAFATEARSAIDRLGDAALRAALALLVADPLLESPALRATTHALLQGAYDSASGAGNAREAAQALGLLGTLQARAGMRAPAAATLSRAVALSRAAGEDPWGFRWHWMLGRVQRESGNDEAARAAFSTAVEMLEEAKSRYALAGTMRSRVAWRDVYVDLVDLRLRDAAVAPSPAARKTAILQARDTLELSRTAEIEDFFNDPCIAARAERSAPIEDIDAKVAVLYPVSLADRVEVLVGHRTGFALFTVKRPSGEVTEAVNRLRAYLEKRTTRQYLRPALELHQALIAPVEAHLASLGVTTLVIVPDGALRTVPFAALHDGKTFLVERYAVAVTPIASLTQPRPIPAGSVRALLSGLTESRQGFAALPAVGEELDSLAKLLSAPVYRDSAFSSAKLESALSQLPINVLHIASHGQFSRDPSETFLLTFDGHVTLTQLRRALAAGKLREEPLELLALSACQTAAGDERAALGLAGVALGAGARSALASLWAVNDESTSALIQAFYAHLVRGGLTKAQALRQAQIDLSRDERFAHPAYWAPFLVIGNWL